MTVFAVVCVFWICNAVIASFVQVETHVIEIVGNKFFNTSDGEQFFIKGLAYQRNRRDGEDYNREKETAYIDSLAQPSLCLRDIEYFKELGINTVRVYQVDPKQNHDVCMNALANYGIYVLADLGEPEMSINREDPFWDVDLYERYTAVVDNMHMYPNLLGFIAGNEVVTSKQNTNAAAFAKAAIRDVKHHIEMKGYRLIPVGYASNDDAVTRMDAANYFVCNEHDTHFASADFYALNMFEWCGYSSYATSGYRERTIEFGQMPVPVFFSEFGCNVVSPRPFTEIELIFGPTMSRVWSGGIVYEFLQHDNKYGLVEEDAHGHMVKREDFNIVKLRLLENVPRGVHRDAATTEYHAVRQCPPVSSTWQLGALLPPTPDTLLCECLEATLSCVITPYSYVHEHNLLRDACAVTDCNDITSDSASGRYGRFASCGIRQRISYALDKHWTESGKQSCDFDGRAVLLPSMGSLDSVFTSNGQSCRAIGELFTKPSASNYTARRTPQQGQLYHLLGAAPSLALWGVLAVPVIVMSLLYLVN